MKHSLYYISEILAENPDYLVSFEPTKIVQLLTPFNKRPYNKKIPATIRIKTYSGETLINLRTDAPIEFFI